MTALEHPLVRMAREMREAVGVVGDPELAHAVADQVLVEAVEWLASATERDDVVGPMKQLVADFHRMKKWYA